MGVCRSSIYLPDLPFFVGLVKVLHWIGLALIVEIFLLAVQTIMLSLTPLGYARGTSVGRREYFESKYEWRRSSLRLSLEENLTSMHISSFVNWILLTEVLCSTSLLYRQLRIGHRFRWNNRHRGDRSVFVFS